MSRAAAAAILLVTATAGCAPGDGGPTVQSAVLSLPAVPGGPGAAYFTIRSSNGNRRLVSVTGRTFERAELHNTMQHGDMTSMGALRPDDLVAGPDAPLVFAPGGKHAMLFGVDRALRPGAKVQMTFQMDSGSPLEVEADVVGPGQAQAR